MDSKVIVKIKHSDPMPGVPSASSTDSQPVANRSSSSEAPSQNLTTNNPGVGKIKLPINIASKQDITHVCRELSVLIDELTQNAIRGKKTELPSISEGLMSLVQENQVDLADPKSCKTLLEGMKQVKKSAPSVRISFAVEPSAEVLQKIVAWFRVNTDPSVVIQVGLQPSIAAGVVLRTPNKQFDFSLRDRLNKNCNKLIEALNG